MESVVNALEFVGSLALEWPATTWCIVGGLWGGIIIAIALGLSHDDGDPD